GGRGRHGGGPRRGPRARPRRGRTLRPPSRRARARPRRPPPSVPRRRRPGRVTSRGLRGVPDHGQAEREAGAATRPVTGGDRATVRFDDLACDREPEPGPPRPRGEERLEDAAPPGPPGARARGGDVGL